MTGRMAHVMRLAYRAVSVVSVAVFELDGLVGAFRLWNAPTSWLSSWKASSLGRQGRDRSDRESAAPSSGLWGSSSAQSASSGRTPPSDGATSDDVNAPRIDPPHHSCRRRELIRAIDLQREPGVEGAEIAVGLEVTGATGQEVLASVELQVREVSRRRLARRSRTGRCSAYCSGGSAWRR